MKRNDLKKYINDRFTNIETIDDLDQLLTFIYNQDCPDVYERLMSSLIDYNNKEILNLLLRNLKELRLNYNELV